MRMRYLLLLSLLGAVLGGMGAQAAIQPIDFEYRTTLEAPVSTEGSVARATLPESILRVAARGFADVRILDESGQEIPYVIYPASETLLSRDYFALKVLAYRDLPQGSEVVLERPEKRASFDGLSIQTYNRNFRKFVTIESSADRSKWKVIQRDAIFDFSSRVDLRKNEIKLSRTKDRYLRVTLREQESAAPATSGLRVRYQGLDVELNNSLSQELFRIEGINAWSGENEKREAVLEELALKQPPVEIDKDGNSVIALDVGNLRIRSLAIGVEGAPYYYRRIELWGLSANTEKYDRQIASGWIYRLPGMEKPETQINLHGSIEPTARLKIINGNNPPLSIQSLTFQWLRNDLYFFARTGAHYTLYVGNKELNPPDYEIGRIIGQPGLTDAATTSLITTQAIIGSLEKNPVYRPASFKIEDRTQRVLLIGLVIVFGIGLACWAYTLLRQTTPEKKE